MAKMQRRYERTADGEKGPVAMIVTLSDAGQFEVFGKPDTPWEIEAESVQDSYRGISGEDAWERYVMGGSSGYGTLLTTEPAELTDKMRKRIRAWARGDG